MYKRQQPGGGRAGKEVPVAVVMVKRKVCHRFPRGEFTGFPVVCKALLLGERGSGREWLGQFGKGVCARAAERGDGYRFAKRMVVKVLARGACRGIRAAASRSSNTRTR